MARDEPSDRRYREYGQSWEIAAALWDGPRTLPEIVDHFHSYIRLLGLFSVTGRMERRHRQMAKRIEEAVEQLIERGRVVREGERYALTSLGREEASKPLADMRRTRASLGKLAQPQTVSKVGLVVHLGLATLKLPAGLLSGSVGLLNDALDTLLDGFSSLLVYLGFRFNRERAVNVVLVLLMLGTGGFTFYEAVRRFFVPFEPEVDWFTFVAAIFSALICSALYLYQRFVGLRSGSLALITQSVDSRNHVIVAVGVTSGLVASLLRFPLLDTLVGLAVAVLILKSAVELAVEAVRSLGEEEVDLSRYRFGVISKYNQFRQAQLRDWMLYLVEKQRAKTHTELIAQAHRALDFSRNPMLRELGLEKSSQASEMIKQSMANLFERGWLIGEERLSVTAAGRNHLHKQISEPFRPIDRHRSVIITARPIRETGITVMCAFILTVAWFILSLLPDSRLWASTEPFYRWGNYGFTYFTMLHVLAGFPLYLYSVLSIINITKENHAAQDRKTGTAVRLLKDGHYAKVRHPMYGMMITSWIGLGVALCSYWGLAVATIMTLLFAVNGVLEEKRDLIPRFGKKYLAYAKQVRARYLPIGLRAYVMCIVGLCLLGLFL